MNSPVSLNFLHFIRINRNSDTAIYIQLSQQIINCIQRGYLNPGDKLPGTRQLALELQLNRNTIVNTFNELLAQGWIEIIPNKGTFVLKQFDSPIANRPYETSISINKYPENTGYTFSKSIILDYPTIQYKSEYFFTDGTPDVRLNQFKELSSRYSASMNRKTTIKNLTKYSNQSNIFFKEQLSNYLNQTRGLHIGKENLLINRSPEISIYLLARVLISQNDLVIVAEWSNPTINMSFLQAGAKLLTIPIDDEGIQVDKLEKILQKNKTRLLYITPHHHYPTTVTLSATRRISLLKLAKQYGFIIIEDDYDYDFHYEKSAILPITSADTEGMLIYTGTFGKPLAPSFQTSFIVAPQNLIKELHKYLGILDKQGDPVMEQTLGEMIQEGDIHRYLKKTIQVYKERRDYICSLLDLYFPTGITYHRPSGGLAIWVNFESSISLNKLSKESYKQNLKIPSNILYQNKNTTAMRLGFGHMNEHELKNAIALLKKSIENMEKQKNG